MKLKAKAAAMMSLVIMAAGMVQGCGRKETRKVQLVTYNVGAFGKEMEDSAPMIAAMLHELGADVVALNELDSCNRRHDLYQAEHLAECLDSVYGEAGMWNYEYASAMPYADGGYGDALVCRDEILNAFSIALPRFDGSEPRVCVVAETEDYVFASTHLDHVSMDAQLRQAQIISERLKSLYGTAGKPVFLAGDLNAEPDSPTVTELLADWTLLSAQDGTFPADGTERRCIDYIMQLNNGAQVKVLETAAPVEFRSGDTAIASDHLPVFVTVEL